MVGTGTPRREGGATPLSLRSCTPTRMGSAAGSATPTLVGDKVEKLKQVVLVAQVPLGDTVRCAAPAPDGKVWTGERGGGVAVRDPSTTEHLCEVPYRPEAPGVLPNALAHCPEHGCVWVGFSDGSLRVFSQATGEVIAELHGHSSAVLAVLVDGPAVYSAGQDWKITQWSAEKFRQVTTYTGHKNAVRCLAMTAACLASGSDDSSIRLWNAARRQLKAHTGSVLALATIRGYLWSGGEDGVLCVWEVESGTLLRKTAAHGAPVTVLVALEEGEVVWSTDKHGIVVIWDARAVQMVQRMSPDSSDWQRNGITAAVAAERVTSWRVWTCSGDGNVRVWSTPCVTVGETVAALEYEVATLRQGRNSQAEQLESLLAAHNSTALKEEVQQLRAALHERQEILAETDRRVVQQAAEADTLRFEVEKSKACEVELDEERHRRLEAEAVASRAQAKLVVLQQECAAKASALAASETERHEHRLRLDRLIEVEREVEAERGRRKQSEDTVACFEAQNTTLREELRRVTGRLQAAESAARRTHTPAAPDPSSFLAIAASLLMSLEVEERSVLIELRHDLLADLQACATPSFTSRRSPSPAASPRAPIPTTRHDDDLLLLRIQTLESALADSHRKFVSFSSEEKASIAKGQQLESMLLAHKAELSETAGELARVRCDLAAKVAEAGSKDRDIARLQENLALRDDEVVRSSAQVQVMRQQLEQNISCICQLEAQIKRSEEERAMLDEELRRLHGKVDEAAAEKERLAAEAAKQEATLQEGERLQREEAERARRLVDVLRADLDACRTAAAKQDERILRLEKENTDTVSKYSDAATVVETLRAQLTSVRQSLADATAISEAGTQAAVQAEAQKHLNIIAELNSALTERDAKVGVLQATVEAKSEQLARQTEVLSGVVDEVTERRRHASELESKLEDLEQQSRTANQLTQTQRESVARADAELQSCMMKWARERGELEMQAASVKEAHEATRLRLDTTLRELALVREDSQCEIQMLHQQLAAKSEELARVARPLSSFHQGMTPPASPNTPYVFRMGDGDAQTPARFSDNFADLQPALNRRSLSPNRTPR